MATNDVGKSGASCCNSLSAPCAFKLSDGKLSVNGVTLLSEVPENVTLTKFCSSPQSSDAPVPLVQKVQSASHRGGFLGFSTREGSDNLKTSLGRFTERNFLSIFRFKTWWSTQWVGRSGSDLQMETQWLLLDVPELGSYALILPLVEGSFRSALHPGTDGHVILCAESGSTKVKTSTFTACAYVHVSDNPYVLMKEAYGAARVHLNTFRLLEEKSVPSLVDKFGWCTWDAFYLTVNPVGVWHGAKEFVEGGVPLRFLIIDDGWQSISLDGENPFEDAKNLVLGGTQMTARLYRFEECEKFRKYKKGTMLSNSPPAFDPAKPKMLIGKAIELEQAEKTCEKAIQAGVTELSGYLSKIKELRLQLHEMYAGKEQENEAIAESDCCEPISRGMKAFTSDLRTAFKGLDDIYVWHALCGAWGGVRPGTTHLNSKITPVVVSPGLAGTMTDLAVEKIKEGGIGLVHPNQATDFYDSMHSYLASAGITGVKVDVIHTLEYVSEEYGGRVQLANAYYGGLTKSLTKNFKGTGLISSMQQCNDFFFLGTWKISMGRVGDDFWFQDPNGDPMGVYWLQGLHMIHCAYNSLWMGQIIQPDWDMFQSDHLCAKFHAGSRAICGGPIYVSDSLSGHDFQLIKKLVFPDGTIPKCLHFALPTRDCLFKDPLSDGETILKIWNFNKFGGVIGAFNCQGAGWNRQEQRFKGYPQFYKPVSGSVCAKDIEWDQKKEAAQMGESEEYAIYLSQAVRLLTVNSRSEAIHITIEPSSFEIFSFVPLKRLGQAFKFAPIGLVDMFNSGGTILDMVHSEAEGETSVRIQVKGAGSFLAYANVKPKSISMNEVGTEFEWLDGAKLLIDVPCNEQYISDLMFHFSLLSLDY
ncbi:stachyose synthase [Nymphaea colorata]|nr:stachyose synthase [Nymphaea colorata]